MTATCRRCGRHFSLPFRAGNKPGFCGPECRKAHRLDYYREWTLQNVEQVKSERAEYRKRYKQEQPDYWKRYYADNKERRKADANAWYQQNKDRAAERQKAWCEKNLERVRAAGRVQRMKRRAIEKAAFVEKVVPAVVFDRDRGLCGLCGDVVAQSSDWHVDHIIPLSKGGEHSYANVQLAHASCNRSKGARLPEQRCG